MNPKSSKNLSAIQAGISIALSKVKSWLQLIDSVLGADKHALLLADHWLDELIAWADENHIMEMHLPRDEQRILQLTKLNLYDNQLTSLPDSLGNLTNLTSLHLYDNQLTSLPDSLGKLTNLEWLNLHGNPIKALPPSLSHLQAIVHF